MKTLITVAALAALAGTAYGQTFNEIGDATDTPPGQSVTDGTIMIMGTDTGNDADVYGFSWGGGILTMDTFDSALFDTQLHLFTIGGIGIGENDDSGNGGDVYQSQISMDLAAGAYLIGITAFNNDAQDAAGLDIFGFTNYFYDRFGNGIEGPESNGHGALAQWDNGGGDSGDYFIHFSAPVNGVPAPGAMALLGLGGLAAIRRRR